MTASTTIICTKSEFGPRLSAEFVTPAPDHAVAELVVVVDGLVRQAEAHRGVFTGHSAYLDCDFIAYPDETTIPAVTDAQREQSRIAVRGTMRDVRTSLAGMLEGAFTLSPEGLESLADRLHAAAGHLRIAEQR